MVVVTDASGLVLHRVGDEWLKERAAEMKRVEGARYSEAADGTNGIGTALPRTMRSRCSHSSTSTNAITIISAARAMEQHLLEIRRAQDTRLRRRYGDRSGRRVACRGDVSRSRRGVPPPPRRDTPRHVRPGRYARP